MDMNTSTVEEIVAEKIYDIMPFTEKGEKPKWVPNGNSLKQNEARIDAREIIAILTTALLEAFKKDVGEMVERIGLLTKNINYTKTHCNVCGGHFAAGECDCIGYNEAITDVLTIAKEILTPKN